MKNVPIVHSTVFSTGFCRIYGISHPGWCRRSNEDRFLIKAFSSNAVLLAVADGLGDSPAASASEMVRQTLAEIDAIPCTMEIPALLQRVRELDGTIREKSRCCAEELGSTLLAVVIRSGMAHWVHVGDSRLYLYRAGELRQLTEDQTLARFLMSEKEITPEQAQTHYSRRVMDQCVGCGYAEPETGELRIHAHDWLILSTDGLHNLIGPAELASILQSPADLAGKAEMLVQAALEAGGTDNITAVLMQS